MNNSVQNYLHSLGLIPSEAKLYIILLKQTEPLSVLEISGVANMPRTTVHENIETLVEKGLVNEIKNDGRRKLIAEEPFVLQTFLEEQQLTLKKRLLQLKSLKERLPRYVTALTNDTPLYL